MCRTSISPKCIGRRLRSQRRFSLAFHSPQGTDPFSARPLPSLSPPIALLRQLRLTLFPPAAIRSTPKAVASNVPHVSVLVHRSPQNVSETLRPSPPMYQSPCSRSPPSARLAGAIHPAASPATTSPSVVAPTDPPLRDLPYSKQKYLQSPSIQLSCSGCRRPSPEPAPQKPNS